MHFVSFFYFTGIFAALLVFKMFFFWHSIADVPSSPEIELVEPFSSTAVVSFEEPDSMGGVPIIKYRVEWRLPGQDWTGKEYHADDGESPSWPLICIHGNYFKEVVWLPF